MTESRRTLASWDFSGQTALITGAGGDIGRAVAFRLAAAGARIALIDVADDALDATAAQCGRHTVDVVTHLTDVGDAEAVASAVRSTAGTIGHPQLVFNNAGIQGEFARTDRYPAADLRRVLEVNVAGAFNVLAAVGTQLREAGLPGSIVNTASMAHVGPPNMVAYGASKGALITMTKTAAKDLAPLGIRVNAISPAFIGPGRMWDRQTQLQAKAGSPYFPHDAGEVAKAMVASVPLRRLGSVDEVASVVVFLLSDEASYLTGINIDIAGGVG